MLKMHKYTFNSQSNQSCYFKMFVLCNELHSLKKCVTKTEILFDIKKTQVCSGYQALVGSNRSGDTD